MNAGEEVRVHNVKTSGQRPYAVEYTPMRVHTKTSLSRIICPCAKYDGWQPFPKDLVEEKQKI